MISEDELILKSLKKEDVWTVASSSKVGLGIHVGS